MDVLAFARTVLPKKSGGCRVRRTYRCRRAANFDVGGANGVHSGKRNLPSQLFAVEASFLQQRVYDPMFAFSVWSSRENRSSKFGCIN